MQEMLDNQTHQDLKIFRERAFTLLNKLSDENGFILPSVTGILLCLKDPKKHSKKLTPVQINFLKSGPPEFFNTCRLLGYLAGDSRHSNAVNDMFFDDLLNCQGDDSSLKKFFESIPTFPQYINYEKKTLLEKALESVYTELKGFVNEYLILLSLLREKFKQDNTLNKSPQHCYLQNFESLFSDSLKQKLISKADILSLSKKLNSSRHSQKNTYLKIMQDMIDPDSSKPRFHREILALGKLQMITKEEMSAALTKNNFHKKENRLELSEVTTAKKHRSKKEKPLRSERKSSQTSEEKIEIPSSIYESKLKLMEIEKTRQIEVAKQKEAELEKQKKQEAENRILSLKKSSKILPKKTYEENGEEDSEQFFETNLFKEDVKTSSKESQIKKSYHQLNSEKSALNIAPVIDSANSFFAKPINELEEIYNYLSKIRVCQNNPLDYVKNLLPLLSQLEESSLTKLFQDQIYGELIQSIFEVKEWNEQKMESLLNTFYIKIMF